MSNSTIEIHGYCDERYRGAYRAFEENFRIRGEIGAEFCVVEKGEPVVHLWAGYKDKKRESLWRPDSKSVVFSCTKGMAALCFLIANQDGAFQYEDRVSEYWPEFGAAGKKDVTIGQLLSHSAGLPALDSKFSVRQTVDTSQQQRLLEALERQRPHWKPGTSQGYHIISYGLYASELFKRITDTSLGDFFEDRVRKCAQLDVWLRATADAVQEIVPVIPISTPSRLRQFVPQMVNPKGTEGRVGREFFKPDSLARKALTNPGFGSEGLHLMNDLDFLLNEMAWGGGVASAKGLATLYNALATDGVLGGVEIVGKDLLQSLHGRASWEDRDRILQRPMGWTRGFVKETPGVFGPHTESFGHPGLGGYLGWADPVNGIGIGYVMNALDWRVRSPRAMALTQGLYQ